jgi:hypothetical protein
MRRSVPRLLVLSLGIGLLAGCSTPETILRHPATGQVARCGGNVTGSLAGGMIGYTVQESNDSRCVASFLEQGFVRAR